MSAFAGMRIALVGPLAPPAGGMAGQTLQLAELLRGEGASVEIVQTNAPYRPAWAAAVPVVRAGFRLVPYLLRLWNVIGRSDVVHVMANSGWSWHLFAAPAIRVAAWRGTPVVVNYRGGEARPFLERSQASVRRTMRLASRLIVPSGFLQRVFADFGMEAQVVPNVVDLSRFSPATLPRAPGPHLVVTRNLEPIYDNATAIRAFAAVRQRFPSARLTIAGSGPELRALQSLASELGVDGAVEFAGRLDRDQVAELYRRADLVLNPSTADNMPNSVLEAMASGVPVVSTNVGGVPFILRQEQTGLLVEPAQPDAMARASLALLESPQEAARLAAAARRDVQQYTWAAVSGTLAAVYRDAARIAEGRGLLAR